MLFIYKSIQFGPCVFFSFLVDAIKYQQNIFIGMKNWLKTYKQLSSNIKKNKRYITR